MAGIFGIYDPELDAEQLQRLAGCMQSAITHQPWYQSQLSVQSPFAAGRVSLGIVNPRPQPGCNEDGSVLVWMDGEIYEFQRQQLLRHLRQAGHRLEGESHAEIVAHLYEDLGDDCVRDLDANFAVAIYDQRQDKVLIATDRDANRFVYFHAHGPRFLFASEVKAILQDARVPRRLDECGLVEFFSFRHVMADRTLLRDVRFLPAGCRAIFQRGQLEVRPYWEPRVIEDDPPRAEESYLTELADKLRTAVDRQTEGDHTFGVYISGGLDSRLITGVVPDRIRSRLHTYTFGPSGSWDVKYGRLVGARLGGQHHTLDLRPEFLSNSAREGVWLTDGLMTVNDIYMLNGIRMVKPQADIVFYGMGRSDGILGGIELNARLLRARSIEETAHNLYSRQGLYIADALKEKVLSPALNQATRGAPFEALLQMLRTAPGNSFATKVEAFCLQCRWPRSSGYGAVLSRSQVETRFPYSDNELADLAFRVPARWRVGRRLQIALIKRTRPDLARVPWEWTGLPLTISTPHVIFIQRARYYLQRQLSKATRGLIPLGTARERANWPEWFRTSLRPWLEGLLLDKRTLERGYYQPAFLRQMVDEHMSGRQNYATEFGLLATFELWNRLFIDGEAVHVG